MTSVTHLSRLVLIGIAAACLAGCSDGSRETSLAALTFEPADPTVGDAALLTGTVVDADGCFGVEAEGAVYLPVFPSEDATLRTADVGDTVVLGGSEKADLPTGTDVPEPCSTGDRYWQVVSQG